MRVAMINKSVHGFPIEIQIDLDGTGKTNIETGVGFFNHMLELLAKHGGFDISISCSADLHVDDHHLVDEIGMSLGLAFKNALRQNSAQLINRYGFYILPMDEVLTTCAIDISNRSSFVFDVEFQSNRIGGISSDNIKEFWNMFAQKAELNFIVKSEFGSNDHHIAEGLFKCIARSLRMAVQLKHQSS